MTIQRTLDIIQSGCCKEQIKQRKDEIILNDKTKEAMMNRLVGVYNNAVTHGDICLSVIAICMLESIPTVEELTRRGSTRQSQFCEQVGQVRPSEQ